MATLLIVEDDPGSTKFLQKIITRLGHEALCAENGADGLRLASEQNPDLILSDLKMPGKPDGIELIRALRTACPRTGMIIISGYPTEEVLQECKRLGVDEFLTKPFEVGFVREVVEKLLQNPPTEHMSFA